MRLPHLLPSLARRSCSGAAVPRSSSRHRPASQRDAAAPRSPAAAWSEASRASRSPHNAAGSGKRYAIVMSTTCGADPHRARSQARRRDPQLDRVPGHRSASSTGSRSTAWSGASSCRAPIPVATARAAQANAVVGKLPTSYHYKLGDFAMAKTAVDPSGTAGSQFFVISGPEGSQLPPRLRPPRTRRRQRVAGDDQAHQRARDAVLRQLAGLPSVEAGVDHHRARRAAAVASRGICADSLDSPPRPIASTRASGCWRRLTA